MISIKSLPHGPREHKLLKEERAQEGAALTPVPSAAAGFNLTVRSRGAVLGRRLTVTTTDEYDGGHDE